MSALASVRIRNYRCFSDHTVDFGAATIVVGRNNAGKSTLIEVLRLISVMLPRFRNVVSAQAPRWLDDYAAGQGQRLDINKFGISSETVFHRYGDPPATIEARFGDGSQLTIYIGHEGEGHAIFTAADGSIVRRRSDLRFQLPSIAILPQTVPLERDEKVLSGGYVRDNLNSHLASRHFRNQLYLLHGEFFDSFKELVEESWHTVRVDGLDLARQDDGEFLRLMVRDGGFVAEIGWMGHGLQMWLQTIWFVTRTAGSDVLVLDEPDVYMHPDLQRKLMRFLSSQQRQIVVATHSTEILSEIDASNVLVLDRTQQRSSFATGLPAVQKVIEGMGSAQNLQITRLWRSKILVLVEGDDMKVLRRIGDLVNPGSALGLDALPNWSIGGWTGWGSALGSATALQNSVHEDIVCYCLFDSDYHLEDEIGSRYRRADEVGIRLHILKRKEIENYLLVPSLIRRVIGVSAAPLIPLPTEEDIVQKIDDICSSLLDEVRDCFATEYSVANRGVAAGTAARWAREHVALRWGSASARAGVVSGKKVISALSAWSKEVYGVSFSVAALLRSMHRNEVADELAMLVDAISRCAPIPTAAR